MSARPRAVILRAAGTNCDEEMVRAFTLAGADAEMIHLRGLIDDPARLRAFDLIGLPGGFSYGDDIASGRVFAVLLRERLYPALREAAMRGVPMIGACNGFQVLTQVGLLPGPSAASSNPSPRRGEDVAQRQERGSEPAWPETPPPQTCALTDNAAARFSDRWVRVEAPAETRCIWTAPLRTGAVDADAQPDTMMLPIAHGEGRFVTNSPETLRALEAGAQIALRYAKGDNPNGSEADIAGICDASGLIFGLMPHPERYTEWTQHPFWTRLPEGARTGEPPGLRVFRAAVEYVARRGEGGPGMASFRPLTGAVAPGAPKPIGVAAR